MNKKIKRIRTFLALMLLMIYPSILFGAQKGMASWYSKKEPGTKKYTANGEVFDDRKLTCASRSYSFGTRLRVRNLKNGKSVVCRVNDRGPHRRLRQRKVDLTKTAFNRISDSNRGLVHVSITEVSD